jgi:hypothetical protein
MSSAPPEDDDIVRWIMIPCSQCRRLRRGERRGFQITGRGAREKGSCVSGPSREITAEVVVRRDVTWRVRIHRDTRAYNGLNGRARLLAHGLNRRGRGDELLKMLRRLWMTRARSHAHRVGLYTSSHRHASHSASPSIANSARSRSADQHGADRPRADRVILEQQGAEEAHQLVLFRVRIAE